MRHPLPKPLALLWAAACAGFAACLLAGLSALVAPAWAGTLTKADVEAMFPPPLLVGEKLAHLPVWPVYVRTGQGPVLQNHVFETVDLEPVAGYGGKPINVLVVMDRDGAFVQARLLSHMEPIFRSEAGTKVLTEFGQQYQGLTVNHHIQVLTAKAQRVVTPTTATLHGIVAGTVTATAIDRSIMEAAAQVAQAHADPAAAGARAAAAKGPDDRFQRTGFNGLAAARLVQPWELDNRRVQAAFQGGAAALRDAEAQIRPQAAAVDLWLSFVGLPQAGRNLLEAPRWRQVRERREAGDTVLLVLDGGRYPLAAPALSPPAPRGAELTLQQAGRAFALEPLPWDKGLRLAGTHSGVAAGAVARYFTVRPAADGTRLDPLQPVQFALAVWRRAGDADGDVVRASFEHRFEIPDAAAYAPQRETPKWLEPWAGRAVDLAITAAALALLTAALIAQRRTAATRRRLLALRLPFLVFTLVFVGWVAQGQLTIVTLTSGIEAAVAGRALDFLLADPMAVLLWGFTLVTLVVWGRGTFCGWLCPFGALQELMARAVRLAGFAQRRLRLALDLRLKRLKYAVLAVLAVGAAAAPAATEWLVEVEPFKTAISLHFQREWPYLLWALLCLAAGLLVYRGYCRYLCPLGALLALGGRLRRFDWIARRAECGTPCQSCRHRCDYQAIAPAGKVDYDECFQCLDCVQLHDDTRHCLPLVAAARGRPLKVAVRVERPQAAGSAG